MPESKPSKRLKKELGLFDVYAIATGATLSSGFFLLPGLAAVGAGKTVIPRGNTVFQEGDRLTIIGHSDGLHQLSKHYAERHEGDASFGSV